MLKRDGEIKMRKSITRRNERPKREKKKIKVEGIDMCRL